MARQEIGTNNARDIKKEIGKEIEGTYIGKKEIVTKIGPQVIWQFHNEDGVGFGIYGFTQLNYKMENVPLNTLCWVTYTGTQNLKTKFGMKDVHQVKVEIDNPDLKDGEIPF